MAGRVLGSDRLVPSLPGGEGLSSCRGVLVRTSDRWNLSRPHGR